MCVKRVHFCLFWLSPCILVCLSPCLSHSRADFDEVVDSPMYHDPELSASSVVKEFPKKAIGLWLKALDRPEVDMKCKAADAIALAQRRGVKGLEATVEPLLATLDLPDQHASVRLAAARALIALDARKAAPSLFRQAQTSRGDLRQLIEPTLAHWDYRPARTVWLDRLRDPATRPADLVLAIQALATVKEGQASDRLLEIVMSSLSKMNEVQKAKDEIIRLPSEIFPVSPALPFLRFEAARALGGLRDKGLEEDAARLAADASLPGLPNRLAAANLLRRHKSEEAIRLLQHLTEDPEPAVVAGAAASLLEIDPELLVPAVEGLLASPDQKVRSLGNEVLFRRPTEKHIRLLTNRLDDIHPAVRRQARQHLEKLAATKKELRDPIIAEATRIMKTGQSQGLEQATILLTLLDHKAAAKRLVELLTFDRAEVRVTAAWGLRKLAVPETLPGIQSYIDEQLQRPIRGSGPSAQPEGSSEIIDHQLSQLNQFLARQKERPTVEVRRIDETMRRFIPRRPDNSWPESRAAAIWALGLIHEGKPDAKLAAALELRLTEARMPPEFVSVRRMSVVTIGRIKAQEILPTLQKMCPVFEPSTDPVTNACCWSISQLTGQPIPAPSTLRTIQRDWFLTPNE